MVFYNYFSGQGREILVDVLGVEDPFGLPPAKIVERVLELGNRPDVSKPRSGMWPTVGQVYEVRQGEKDYLVAIGRDAEEISVQEVRSDWYKYTP